jgi:hypothetical protein
VPYHKGHRERQNLPDRGGFRALDIARWGSVDPVASGTHSGECRADRAGDRAFQSEEESDEDRDDEDAGTEQRSDRAERGAEDAHRDRDDDPDGDRADRPGEQPVPEAPTETAAGQIPRDDSEALRASYHSSGRSPREAPAEEARREVTDPGECESDDP